MARKGNRAGFAAALSIGLVIVGLVVALNDPVTVAWRIVSSRPEYILLAAFFDFVSIVFYALAWLITARAVRIRIRAVDGVVASILSIFADKLVASASISGEAVRLAYVKSKYEDAGLDELLATIMVHRFLYNVAFVGLVTAAFIDIGLSEGAPPLLTFLLLLSLASTVFVSYFLVRPESLRSLIYRVVPKVERALSRLLGRDNLGIAKSIEGLLVGLEKSLKLASNNKPYLAAAGILMILQWIAGALEFMSVFEALNHRISPWVALLVFPLHCFLTALPVGLPAALGVVEAGTLILLVSLGVNGATATAATLLTRFVEVWFEILLALVVVALVSFREYGPHLMKYAEELVSSISR